MLPKPHRWLALAVAALAAHSVEAQTRRPPAQGVSAVAGAAIGGDAINSTIKVGYTAAEVERLIVVSVKPLEARNARDRADLREAERRLSLSDGQLRAILTTLARAGVAPEQLESKLGELAGRSNALAREIAQIPATSPAIGRLKAEVEAAFKAGRDAEADALLARIALEQDKALAAGLSDRAATAARRADLAVTQLRYRDAAIHYAEAARFEPDNAKRLDRLWREADTLYLQGLEFGDNAALEASILRWRALLLEYTRERAPLDWAATQNNLGNALLTLGEREAGTERLHEAVAAYRAALRERTRERAPLAWATTQNNLGNALRALGDREAGTARLDEAVAAYRAALLERTRERVPLDWAGTQNNLGNALMRLGGREAGTARLDEAVAAYRAALLERTRERAPLDWAMTQNNLGAALRALGEREAGTARLDEAVAAYRAALLERTRERAPLAWATTQNNLGNALSTLGGREAETERLDEAVAAYRAALLERTRERVPLDWAATQANLAIVETTLGDRAAPPASIAHYRSALARVTQAAEVFQVAGATHLIATIAGAKAEIEASLAATP